MSSKYNLIEQFTEQIQHCTRCGFCQAHCPVFGATGRPALNARGKMLLLKEVLVGKLELNQELVDSLFQCTTCATCATNCPSGVDVPAIIKAARKEMVGLGTCHPAFTGMNEVLDEYDNIYAEDEPEDFDRERGKQAEVVYFMGCVGQYREEEASEAALDLLDHLEVDYTLIDEACCSGVLEDVGFSVKPRLASTNIERILATGAGTLVTGCPYCFRTFTQQEAYAPLRDAGLEIVHMSQFLAGRDLGLHSEAKVTYHDPCDLGRHCGIYEEPRRTIKAVAPNFVELADNRQDALCCGAGGGVRGAFAKNSLAMARRRLAQVESSGAEVLLTECNSCVHNLANAKLRAQKFRVMTTPQFFMELIEES
ncbi:(Fe-S)-binding protein [Desulfoferula mesophila]|uniref:(Fe-S)-binding protein n=1 Tax=Desulfoferula mesophila TaxID=3058419 RepID=UPI0030CB1CF8